MKKKRRRESNKEKAGHNFPFSFLGQASLYYHPKNPKNLSGTEKATRQGIRICINTHTNPGYGSCVQ